MTTTITESTQQPITDTPSGLEFGAQNREPGSYSFGGFWSKISRAVRAIITEVGKYSESGDYYVYAEQPLREQRTTVREVWFGRMMLWPDRLWYNRSECASFSLDHARRRSHDEVLYQIRLPK